MANDIIDINVTETVETVAITVNPNLTTVNINKVTGGAVPTQDLQSVTDIGAITTNSITANSIITTIDSTINGVRAGRGNISDTASENTAFGYQALQSVVHTTGYTGYYNTAFGDETLKSLTTGYANDAFGDASLKFCTTGTYNLAIGTAAMLNSTDATINTAIGQYALRDNLSGTKNTAIGLGALMQNTNSFNTAIGNYAGGAVLSTGTENILVGYQAGAFITSGRNNLLIENVVSQASITSGSYNIILNPKQRSGVTTGSNNTIIGCFDNTFSTGLTSNVILANGLGSIRFQSTDTGLTTVPSQTNALIIADTTGKAVATKEYVASVISGGGATNLTTSQTATDFTINSDTGTDASVPLGNGTLAGATLNDYTTAEKNKLGAISGTNTGDQNLQSVTNLGNAIVLPSNKNRGIDITIADLQNQYSNGIRVTLNSQTGTYSNNDAFVAVMNGQNPNTLPNFVGGFYALATGGDNYSFVSEHNTGTVSSSHYIATNATGITSDFAAFNTNNVNVFKVDSLGNTTATKFIKQGGTSSEILAADGSVITAGTNITISGGTISSTGGVPYTGAVSDVNLGEFGIQLGNLEFDNTPSNIPTTVGSMYYNDTDGTLDLILKGGNVKLQIGQEQVVRVVNKTATNITLSEANYQAVRVTGAQGQRLKVDLAQATTDVLSSETIGLVTETIANNAEGFVTTSGLVRNINTTGSLQSETWADGDILYLSPTVAGRITKVKPTAPNHLIIIGYVISAHITQGTIFVKVDNGYELDELHNVKIDTATNNEVLAYTSATDIWENKTPSEAGLQPTLVSATNIKSINGNSILGSGDLVISGTGISSLNGLTGATQTFSIYTTFSGSPSFVSSGTNHQLRLPIAGTFTDYGLITNTTQVIGGNKAFPDGIQIPVPAGNTQTCIVLGGAGGGNATGSLSIGSTTVYPNAQEVQYVKGVTGPVQTQLNGKASEINVAEQTYILSPTFTGTAPTTISSSTYKWQQLGSLVTVRVNLIYTTAGSISQVVIPLPADMPTPLAPTGLSGALDILYYGVGMFNTLSTTVSTVNRTCLLRRNAANTGYEFVIPHSTEVSSSVISLTLQYFT